MKIRNILSAHLYTSPHFTLALIMPKLNVFQFYPNLFLTPYVGPYYASDDENIAQKGPA